MSILVVGSVALDSVETPEGGMHRDILGGSASFFSVVCSILKPARLVAVVGEDFPEEHLQFFRSRGIDLQGLERAQGLTFRWTGRYLPDMVARETLDTQLNVFENFNPQLLPEYRDSRYVFLANIHPGLQLQVLAQVSHPQLVACDTMNLWINTSRPALLQVLQRVQLLLLNDEEARMLSGEGNLVCAARAIRQMGPQKIIIKKGDAGAMLFDEAGIFWAPAFPLERVVDPTGAGDSFAGGLMSYLAHVDNVTPTQLRRAMIYGSVIASFCVEDFSLDRFRTLKKDEVIRRCAAFAELVRFEDVLL
jgi:sugar/nucleoside kinase (ribokinase family)